MDVYVNASAQALNIRHIAIYIYMLVILTIMELCMATLGNPHTHCSCVTMCNSHKLFILLPINYGNNYLDCVGTWRTV